MDINDIFSGCAITIPEILVPKSEYNLKKWAVVACDQYTQDREYWNKVSETAGNEPSTLKIILPEVYLEDAGKAERIASIKETMRDYIGKNIFAPAVNGFIYIERKTSRGRMRKGLIAAVDLECYDWKPGSTAPIRATEATIPERIPPRKEIRQEAPLESSHIMLLINDPEKTFVEVAGEEAKKESGGVCLYETELMADSGSISAWKLTEKERLAKLAVAVSSLAEKNTAPDGSKFIFAVGDGNHSLATAKAVWEDYKKKGAGVNHPARYALVEIVNLYDEGLTFEPIHRVLFGTNVDTVVKYAAGKLSAKISRAEGFTGGEKAVKTSGAGDKGQTFAFIQKETVETLTTTDTSLAPALLQPVLDEFLKENSAVKIDYIHGTDEAERLSGQEGAVSILLPPISKDNFFSTIAAGGPLPRKSFSMGEADEKRFYIECRKITE